MFQASIFLAGASRGVGAAIAELLVQQQWPTIALLRSEATRPTLETMGICIKLGDALNREAVEQAMAGSSISTVISTIGGMPQDGERSDYLGNRNLIDAAVAAGVKRFILVSSIGVGESAQALPPSALEVLGAALEAKARAEKHLIDSGLTYTIIRPGGLKSEAATGQGFLTTVNNISGTIHRADVAQLVCQCLASEKSHHQVLAALDRNMLSRPISVMEFPL